jgi:hypothetical protein
MSANLDIDMLLRQTIVSIKEASKIRYQQNRMQVNELIEFEKFEATLINELLEKLKLNVGKF